MSARPTHGQTLQRTAIGAVAENRSSRPQLVEAHRTVHDVAADQAKLAFEIERRVDLTRDDRRLEPRRPLLNRIDDQVRRLLLSCIVPRTTIRQFGCELLTEQGRDVLAGRGEAVVDG